jgi:hypothetical protein
MISPLGSTTETKPGYAFVRRGVGSGLMLFLDANFGYPLVVKRPRGAQICVALLER